MPWNVGTVAGRWAVELLRQGAIPVANGAHILEEYGYAGLKKYQESEQERQERHGQLQQAIRRHVRANKEPASGEGPEEAEDVLQREALSQTAAQRREFSQLEGELRLVYELLDGEGQHCDILSQRSGLEVGKLTAALTQLELIGLVEAMPGGRYRKK